MQTAMQQLDAVRDELSDGAYLTIADALKAKFDDAQSKAPIQGQGFVPIAFCTTPLEGYTYKDLAQALRLGCAATTQAERDMLEPMVHRMAAYLPEGALSLSMMEVTDHLNTYKTNYPKFHDVLFRIVRLHVPPHHGQIAEFASFDGSGVVKVDLGEWWAYHKESVKQAFLDQDDQEDDEDEEEEA